MQIVFYQIYQKNFNHIKIKMSVNKDVVQMLKNTIATNPKIEQLHLDFMHISDLNHYMDLLSQLKFLKSLSLYGNRLKQLPIKMDGLKSLEFLDLSNNLINDIDLLIQSLRSLPNLKVLKFPVKKERQKEIIQEVKNLELLNELHIIRQPAKKPMALKYMNEAGLNAFRNQMARLYKKIRQFQQSYLNEKLTQNTQQKFFQQVNNIIKQSMKKITQNEGQLTQTLQILYFNKTKYQIYDYIKNRCINIAMDTYGDLGKMIKEVWDTQQSIFDVVVKQCIKLVKIQYQMSQIKKQKNENNNHITLQNKIYAKNDLLEKQMKRIKKQKDELIIQINQLQNENKRYLQSLVRFSKGDKSGFINLHPTPHSNIPKISNPQNLSQYINSSVKPIQRGSKLGNISKQTIPTNYLSGGRNLTLKQLKDTIQQIYQSKEKFDQKNFDGKIPRQTMHQYLFTHLNQKYGLKNLTIEAASSIVGGIQVYSAEDNDVAVFGKILRNQVDEQFKNVQVQLKSTINSLLKMHIKSRVPYKSASQIQNLFKQKINGEISSEQIEDIVKYLYNKSDSDQILRKIDVLFKLNKPRQEPTNRRQIRDEHSFPEKQKKKLKFSVFLKAVLDFQLKNHQRRLKPLVSVFKSRDKDADGIVNEQEFISIVQQLCQQAKDILPEMLMIVDPYETKSITFTQVARLMQNYPQNNPILNRHVEKQQYQDDYD